jgi:adenine-specific DNA-methyltransferase
MLVPQVGGEDKRFKKNIEQILIYSKNITQSKPFNNVYSYIEISELLDLYRQNGISWKYTSIIKDFGKKEYCCSTYDGNGDEIRIYKVKDAVLTSISSIVKEEKISDEEVYYKYFDSILYYSYATKSIRPRVLNKIIQENITFK